MAGRISELQSASPSTGATPSTTSSPEVGYNSLCRYAADYMQLNSSSSLTMATAVSTTVCLGAGAHHGYG